MARRSTKKPRGARKSKSDNGARVSKISVRNLNGTSKTKAVVQKSAKRVSEREPVRGGRTSLTNLRQEIDRVFHELSASLARLSFGRRVDLEPSRRFQAALGVAAPEHGGLAQTSTTHCAVQSPSRHRTASSKMLLL